MAGRNEFVSIQSLRLWLRASAFGSLAVAHGNAFPRQVASHA
jgi:hypothetical protein